MLPFEPAQLFDLASELSPEEFSDFSDANDEALQPAFARVEAFGRAVHCKGVEAWATLLFIDVFSGGEGLTDELKDQVLEEADPDVFIAELRAELVPSPADRPDVAELDLEVAPLEGVGPIAFGASIDEVAELLGPPERVRNWGESFPDNPEMAAKYATARSEYRVFGDAAQMLPTVNYNDGVVTSMEFFPEAHGHLTCRGVELFGPREQVLQQLLALDADAWTNDTQVVFRKLGLALALPSAENEAPAVNVFVEGDMDEHTATMKRVTGPADLK